jgi:1-acyl-sn-glycerol-3-phosphate acyltransferase
MELHSQPGVDLFDGTHPEVRDLTRIQGLIRTLDVLSRHYFRTETIGFDNVPDESCLVVGTHRGGFLATDMFMFFHAWYRRFADVKPLYGLGHDIHFMNPLMRETMCRGGAVRACREVAIKLLTREKHYLAVYPGGARELFTPVSRRNRIDFHGHKGFIKLALEAQVPIVPTVSIGADSFYCLTEGEAIAKALKVDKVFRMPVWPFMLSLPLGFTPGPVPHLPLPTQIRLSVGQPIRLPYGPEAAKDPRIVDELYEKVQSTMQGMRDRLERVRQVERPLLPSARELVERLEHVATEVRAVWSGATEERRHHAVG